MNGCRKHVFKTMCESDKGRRTGRFGDVRYESVKKRTTTKTKTKGTAKAVPKATTTTKKRDDAVWKAMDRRMFMDDERDYSQPIDAYEENERLMSNQKGTRKVTWTEFKRLRIPDEPIPIDRPIKRKSMDLHVTPKNELQMMYLQDAFRTRQASKRKKYKRK